LDLQAVLDLPDSLLEMNTALHVASSRGLAKVVQELLLSGADPCRLDVRGRTAYLVAKDKDVRDAFRRYRGRAEAAAAEPEEDDEQQEGQVLRNWDWAAAAVGPALTEALEKSQKQKERDKKKRAAQRKKEQKLLDEQAAVAAAELLKRQEEEEASRQEALRRQAGVCAACGQALWGKLPIDVLGLKCCNSVCVLRVRRSLAAEAALKRQPS